MAYLSVYRPFPKSEQTGKPEKKMASDLDTSGKVSKSKLWPPKRKPLKLMSKKAKAELKVWTAVKNERVGLLAKKFGFVPCELCDEIIKSNNVFLTADPHHNDRDRRNNVLDNCRILHRRCHTKVHDKNIKDVPSLLY